MLKRIGAIDEFVIQPISEGRNLRCVLAISGWIEDVKLLKSIPYLYFQFCFAISYRMKKLFVLKQLSFLLFNARYCH